MNCRGFRERGSGGRAEPKNQKRREKQKKKQVECAGRGRKREKTPKVGTTKDAKPERFFKASHTCNEPLDDGQRGRGKRAGAIAYWGGRGITSTGNKRRGPGGRGGKKKNPPELSDNKGKKKRKAEAFPGSLGDRKEMHS